MPTAILALNYWLHLLATVVWVGGLAMLTWAAWPEKESEHGSGLLQFEARFRPLANISLAVLLVTGLIQMGGDPHYEGFLKVTSIWSLGLLAKHVIVGAMILVSVVMQNIVRPALNRAALLARKDRPEDQHEETRLRRYQRRLTALNLALGILVLLFTAIITAM